MVSFRYIFRAFLQGQAHGGRVSVFLSVNGTLLHCRKDFRASQRCCGCAQPVPCFQINVNSRYADFQTLYIIHTFNGLVGGHNAYPLQAGAHYFYACRRANIAAYGFAYFAFPYVPEVVHVGIHIRQCLNVCQFCPCGKVAHGVIHDIAGAHAQTLQAVLRNAQRGTGVKLKRYVPVCFFRYNLRKFLGRFVNRVCRRHAHVHFQRVGFIPVSGIPAFAAAPLAGAAAARAE